MLLGLNFSNYRFAVIDNSRGYSLRERLVQPNAPGVPEERVQHCGRVAQGTHRAYATGTVVAANARVASRA